MKIRFPHDYTSHIGTWKAGEVADVSEDLAAWLMRDAGAVEVKQEPAKRAETAPRHDRQVKAPGKTRAAAVKDK